jgi:hypothetical protein
MKMYVEDAPLVNVTPVDDETTEMFFSIWLRKQDLSAGAPVDNDRRVIKGQFRQVDGYPGLGEHARRTAGADSDGGVAYQYFRKWARRFCPEATRQDAEAAASTH